MNDFLYLFAPPAIAFVLFGLQWLLWGRDKTGGKDTVVVQYAPPEGLAGAELVSIRASISALDVESAMTERKKWPQALFSLFYYGFHLYVKLTSGMGFRKRPYWDRDRSAFDE